MQLEIKKRRFSFLKRHLSSLVYSAIIGAILIIYFAITAPPSQEKINLDSEIRAFMLDTQGEAYTKVWTRRNCKRG